MNVTLSKEYHVRKRDIIIYTISIIICVVALTLIITMQVLGEGIFHTNKIQIATEEEKQRLKTEFENMFTNQFIGNEPEISRMDLQNNIVFTAYENHDNSETDYTLNVNIPEINIENEKINEINSEISRTYKQKVNQIINTKGSKTIYSVEYISYVENDVLFLIIRSNLKEGNSAQQSVIDTYSYDIKQEKIINLEELIEKLQYNKQEIQNKIQEEIKIQEKNSKSLHELGYSIYVRDSSLDIYKIENSDCFFINNGRLYIIYSYGNDTLTSEMDFVII